MKQRRGLRLLVRRFPGWSVLRREVARAMGVVERDVAAPEEWPDAAVLLDAHVRVSSFELVATLDVDPARVAPPPAEQLAASLARALGEDVVLDDDLRPTTAPRPLLRASGGRAEARVSRAGDGGVEVIELAPADPRPAPRDERPAAILERFAPRGRRVDGREYFARGIARQVVAAATNAKLAIAGMVARGEDGSSASVRVLGDSTRLSWAEVVFRCNAEALAQLERASAALRFAFELATRDAYFAGRRDLPLAERSDEELRWELAALDSGLVLAALAGALPDDGAAALDRLRAELRRRGAEGAKLPA